MMYYLYNKLVLEKKKIQDFTWKKKDQKPPLVIILIPWRSPDTACRETPFSVFIHAHIH